jgi:PAS domain-containing protein
MTVYTYSEARQRLATLLEQAATGTEVRIRRKDGRIFVIRSATPADSPLDVPGVALGLTTDEIVACVREGRERFVLSEQ